MNTLSRLGIVCFLGLGGIAAASLWGTGLRTQPAPRTLRVEILNDRLDTYVWLDSRVRVSVWALDADASHDPIAVTAATLVIPGAQLGNGFHVAENRFGRGYITLPRNFELERYIRDGRRLRLSVPSVPRGMFSDESPFVADPATEWTHASGSIPLNSNFPPSTVYLAVPDEG